MTGTILPTDPRAELLASALDAANRGWHVFPIRPGCKCPPAITSWEERATIDPERIRRCWATGPFNVGIATGPSGLVVVDPDVPKPGAQPPPEWRLPGVHTGEDVLVVLAERAGITTAQLAADLDTRTVATPSGGTHLYYTAPDDGPDLRNTARSIGWLVDTRAHGGYVLAAGSRIGDRPYRLVNNIPPIPLPEWLTDLLTPRPLPPQEPVTVSLTAGRAGAYLRSAVDRTVTDLRAAPPGGRNRALYGAAVSLGQLVAGGSLAEHEVTALLAQVAAEIGQKPREAVATIRSGLKAGANRPRSVAA